MNIHTVLKNIKDDTIIIFHNDGDGICSAALLKYFFEKQNIETYLISQPIPLEESLIRKVKTTFPKNIVFLDLAADQHTNLVKTLSKVAKVIIIDHHIPIRNLTNNNIFHFNPRFKNKQIYQSTSYLVYKICSKLMDMKEKLWIAGIGIISDYELKDSKDLFKIIEKKYKIKTLEIISKAIASARACKMKSEKIVEILISGKHPEDILNTKLLNYYKKIENELISLGTDFFANATKYNDIFIYELKSKYNLRSLLATYISEKLPNNVIIIFQKKDESIKVSIRHQGKKYNLYEIIKKCIKGIDAEGGGHKNAVAVIVKNNHWNIFKQHFISEIARQ